MLLALASIFALHEYAKCREHEREMRHLERVLYKPREYESEGEEQCSRNL